MTDRSVMLMSVLLLAAGLGGGCADDVAQPAAEVDVVVPEVEQDTTGPQPDVELPEGFVLVGLTPSEGSTSGLEEVALTGGELSGVVAVLFGDSPALDPFAVNDGLLVALTPPHARGLVDVTIIDDLGRRSTLPLAYKYVEPVAVVSVEPNIGDRLGGERIRVYGAGFTPDATVLIGGRAAINTRVIDAFTIEATTPDAPSAQKVDVHVSCSAGVARLRYGFEYTETPLPNAGSIEVTSVSPASGPAEGGTEIVIEGRGFVPGMAVRLGALPVVGLRFEGPTRVRATTPPGSPGRADVRIIASGAIAEGRALFRYESAPAIWTLDPASGSIAGGTRVILRGAGFPVGSSVSLWIGNGQARDVVVVSETEIIATTPPGAVGLVPVALLSSGLENGELSHPSGFVYFDPSATPGTWGERIDGTVNVTVQESRSGARLGGAFVMLGGSLTTPYKGYTDANGQITFSGPGITGDQTVTASLFGYQTFQLAGFGSENVTLPLERAPTCADLSDMPCEQFTEPPPVAFVTARIVGNSKGPTVPFGECRDWEDAPNGLCDPCSSDADCGGEFPATSDDLGGAVNTESPRVCRELGSEGAFCTTACSVDTDCASGFVCLDPTGADKERRCVPPPGTPVTYCDVTESDLFADDSITYPGVYVGPSNVVRFASHLGDFALFCWAGLDVRGDFRPTHLGVTRNLGAYEDGDELEAEVHLDIPLTQKVTLEVDRPTFGAFNQDLMSLRAALNLGGDGVLEFPPRRGFTTRSFVLQVPRELTGDLYDANWDVYTEVSVPLLNGGSAIYERGLQRLDEALDYRRDDGVWAPIASPPQTTRGLATWRNVDGTETVIAVGEKGRVLKAYANTWAHMPSDTDRELLSVATAPSTGETASAIAGGLGGLALHWSGLRWESVPTGTTSSLEGVAFADETVAYAVAGRDILRWDGERWSTAYRGASPLHAVLAKGDAVFAAGDGGVIVRMLEGAFEEVETASNANLRGLVFAADGAVVAVGDAGTILSFDPNSGASALESSPNAQNLFAVTRVGEELVAVGARATLLRRSGGTWVDESVGASTGTLRAVAVGDGRTWAMGSHELVIGPLLGIPESLTPTPGTFLDETLSWQAKPGLEADFTVLEIGGEVGPCSACGMLFTIPITAWRSVLDGDLFSATFPPLERIAAASQLSPGTKGVTIFRVKADDSFDFDHTASTGFFGGTWRAWAWRTEAWIR